MLLLGALTQDWGEHMVVWSSIAVPPRRRESLGSITPAAILSLHKVYDIFFGASFDKFHDVTDRSTVGLVPGSRVLSRIMGFETYGSLTGDPSEEFKIHGGNNV